MEAENMLEGFELLEKSKYGRGKIKDDEASISVNGINLGGEAKKLLENYSNIEVWINKKDKVIAMKPTNDTEIAFLLKKGEKRDNVKIRKIETLFPKLHGRYKIEIKDAYIIIDLKKR